MNTQRVLIVLTLVNLGILAVLTFSQIRTAQASGSAPVLRGSGLEIVDAQGKVRASIQVAPAGPRRFADGSVEKNGKIFSETVLLRLIRPDGRPSVKIETSEKGSGLSLGGGVDPTYVVFNVKGGEPSLALTNKDGKQQLIKP